MTGSREPRRRVSAPFRKIFIGVTLFLLICLVAVIGYMAAGWSLADSVYMVIITIFGVGYGEVQPVQSPVLRALTIWVIISGYAAVIYTVGGFMQMLIDGELNNALGARKMTREIERLSNHTIICGVGRMGTILAKELQASDKPFVVIDNDPLRVQEAQHRGYLAIQGDATEEFVLDQAGIERAAVVATVLADDAPNVFITVTAREMNSDVIIIARGENPRTEKKLLGCGADKVVLPTAIGATKMAHLIVRPSAENLLEEIAHQSSLNDELGQIGLHFHDLAVVDGSPLVGRPLGDIELKSNHGFLIVGIRRADGTTIVNPASDSKLADGDQVIVLGHEQDIPQLAKKFTTPGQQLMYRGVKLPAS